MPLFAVAFSTNPVKDGSVLNGVETPLHVVCDGNVYDIKTKSNVVSEALKETACGYSENDLVSPAPETKLDGALTDVSVTKATPVTVVDGNNVIMAKSAYKNTNDILKQLKIVVFPEDKVSSELIMSDFADNGLGQKITIVRTPAVILEADGKISEVRTSKSTVGEFLADKGITIGPKDEVSQGSNTAITRGMKISVTRVTETDVTEDEVIPFSTVEKKDFNVYQGQTKVESEGLNGLDKKVYRVVNRNGVLTGKTLISETVTQAPKPKVVVTGVKPYGHEDLWNIMVEAGQKYNVDPVGMMRVMYCESGGRVNAVNRGGYKGLFQWDGTFYKYAAMAGVPADYFNPRSQIFATAARVHASGGWRAWSCKP